MTKSVVYYDQRAVVDSTAISTIYYDTFSNEMYVEFHNGTIAGYAAVTEVDYKDFATAASVGQYFQKNVRGKYHGINGDVTLLDRASIAQQFIAQEKAPVVKGKDYTVYVSIEGELKFELDSTTIENAIGEVRRLLDGSLEDGSYKIREVTHHS